MVTQRGMSLTLTRSPLSVIGMNSGAGVSSATSTTRTTAKRRSARLSHEAGAQEEENEPPAKKSRPNAGAAAAVVPTKMLDGSGAGAGAIGAKARRRKHEYTEEADGFSFARKPRGKKDDAASAPATKDAAVDAAQSTASKPEAASRTSAEPVQDAQSGAETADNAAPKTAKKQRKRLPTTPEHKAAQKPVRRSKRLSNENEQQQQPHAASPHKPAHAKSHANTDRSPSPVFKPVTIEKKRKKAGEGGGLEEAKTSLFKLPFAVTPIIRRNQAMRKASGDKDGGRRSSGSLRGRRASSLIDEGRGNGEFDNVSSKSYMHFTFAPWLAKPADTDLQVGNTSSGRHITMGRAEPDSATLCLTDSNDVELVAAAKFLLETLADSTCDEIALPHAEVPTSEFYKHISAELTEPRRMRCLLGWCGSRALPGKPEAPKQSTPKADLEFQALQAARVIQEELSQELVSNGLLSDWFSRDEKAPLKPPKKKPNPRNLANTIKVKELEQELERLKKERAAWDDLLASTSSPPHQPAPTDNAAACLSPVKADLLDSPQRAILEQLQAAPTKSLTAPEDIQQRLRDMAENLEFSIDTFAEGIHQLHTTKQIADSLADKALAGAAEVLQDRQKARRADGKGPSTMESLRGLSRLLNDVQKPRNGRRR